MRVLYLTIGHRTHDDRFVEAINAIGHQAIPVVVEGWDVEQVERAITWARPDVIQAGPLLPVAWIAARCGTHPLVALSWGYDLLTRPVSSEDLARTAWTLESADALVVDCDAARSSARALRMPDDRIICLPWGADLGVFHPLEGKERRRHRRARGWEGALVIVTARAHEPTYGVETVLDGFALVASSVPDLRLVVLGSGSLTHELRTRAARNEIADRVEFAGDLGGRQLADTLAIADVYASASHVDGSSVTLLEAMATGLPCLVSDVGGNREWIEPGLTGNLFPDGDAQAMAAGLADLAAMDEGVRRAMGDAARAVAASRADWGRNRWRLADAYKMAVERPR